jgi:hypothetical protein
MGMVDEALAQDIADKKALRMLFERPGCWWVIRRCGDHLMELDPQAACEVSTMGNLLNWISTQGSVRGAK